MAININTGFKLLNEAESLDSRCLYNTVADMASATIGIYEGCIAYVKEGDEKGYYTFNKANDMDATFGLWRPLSLGGDGDVIDDALEESLTKTYSITKIKELMNKNGGYVLVDVLPDLADEAQRETVALNKIYLVPSANGEDENAKDEYICVFVAGDGADTEDSWAWEKFGSLSGDAGLAWEEDTIVSNPVGKVKKDDNLINKSVLEIVTKMLQTDIDTTIKLVASPSAATLYEKHVANISDVSLTATLSLGTGVVTEGADIVFKKDGVAIDTQAYVGGTSVYTYTDTGANVVADTTYSVEVKYNMDETEKTASDNVKYSFALPLFYGTSATKEVADITALTKVVEKAGTKKFTYTVSNGYCVIAVPTPYTVTKILDQNGFDNTSAFDMVEQVATIGTESITYRVYTNTNACTCTNFLYTFTLA